MATHSLVDGKLFVDFVGAGRWHVFCDAIMRESEFAARGAPGSCRPDSITNEDTNTARLPVHPSMSVSVLSMDPQVLLVRNFLTLTEIQTLTEIARARFRPSRLQHYHSEGVTVAPLRNSSTADVGPPHAFHPRVMAILKRMSALTGVNPKSALAHPNSQRDHRRVVAPLRSHSGPHTDPSTTTVNLIRNSTNSLFSRYSERYA